MGKDAGRIVGPDDGMRSWVLIMLKAVEDGVDQLNLSQTKRRINVLKFQTQYQQRTVGEFFADYQGLKREFLSELCAINFAFIPESKLPYFEQENLFGDLVSGKFPKSCPDIKASGNCLAADLFDAAVFYLMLVVNNGLLALARDLNVSPQKKPLEYEEWHVLIRNIDTKLQEKAKAIQLNAAAGKAKDEELEFYQGLSDSLKYIKDAHRNPIAHARGNYDEDKAVAIFKDVRRFMERLATRVSE